MAYRINLREKFFKTITKLWAAGEPGSGAGSGGGWGGAIREAGGAFGKLEAAREGEFFHRKQLELIEMLKTNKISAKKYHQKQVDELKAQLDRHKEILHNLKK